MNKLKLPSSVLYLLFLFKKKNFEIFLVGGAVRDLLLKNFRLDQELKTIDYDFTTNALPETILKNLPNSFYENNFGTVSIDPQSLYENIIADNYDIDKEFFSDFQFQSTKIFFDLTKKLKPHESLKLQEDNYVSGFQTFHLPNYEITTFRDQETYDDFRRPTSMIWGKTIDDDLKRRDFTVNALAIDVKLNFLEKILKEKKLPKFVEIEAKNYQIIDKHHSIKDLKKTIIRTVGNPDERFREDALRMMRAVRFASQLNFNLEEETLKAIKRNYLLIKHISVERVRDEFFKILKTEQAKQAVELLFELKILELILPELVATRGVEQSGHHITDVWQHSLDSLKFCPSVDPIVKLACLIHDLGKTPTQKKVNGDYIFHNHEIVGASLAYQIGKRLKLSKNDCIRLSTLVRHHMFHYQKFQTDAAIRRFIKNVKIKNLNDIFAVREGDRLGSNSKKTSWRLEEMKERIQKQLHQPLNLKDLKINGGDLIKEFNLRPSPLIGKILNQLMELVLDDEKLNERNILLEKARELI